MESKTYNIEWHGIQLSIIHTPKRWGVIEHLEIRSITPEKAPLPITDTGYKSHFLNEEELAGYNSPPEYVLAWLEHEADTPEWKEQELETRQYSLF